MNDEYLDLINEKDELIGTILRSEAHKDKAFAHRGTALVLFNDKNQVLMCQRSLSKLTNPGLWTVASSGHVKSGRDPIEETKVEAFEELGIEITPIFFTKQWEYSESETMVYYVCYAFYTNSNFIFDKSEIEEAKWVDIEKFEEFCKENKVDSVTYSMTKEIIEKISSN